MMTAATIDRMKLELMSDLTDLVRSGDLTDMQANEWFNMKVEQWYGEVV
jgi:hypothetical protein